MNFCFFSGVCCGHFKVFKPYISLKDSTYDHQRNNFRAGTLSYLRSHPNEFGGMVEIQ